MVSLPSPAKAPRLMNEILLFCISLAYQKNWMAIDKIVEKYIRANQVIQSGETTSLKRGDPVMVEVPDQKKSSAQDQHHKQRFRTDTIACRARKTRRFQSMWFDYIADPYT